MSEKTFEINQLIKKFFLIFITSLKCKLVLSYLIQVFILISSSWQKTWNWDIFKIFACTNPFMLHVLDILRRGLLLHERKMHLKTSLNEIKIQNGKKDVCFYSLWSVSWLSWVKQFIFQITIIINLFFILHTGCYNESSIFTLHSQ